MKRLSFFLISIFSSVSLYPQNAPLLKESANVNGTVYTLTIEDKDYLSHKNYVRYLNRLFGQVAVGSYGGSDLANYATLEPLNGSFAFNGFGSLSTSDAPKLPGYFSLNIKGALVGNNSTALFTDTKLNTNVSAQLKIHLGLPKKGISYLLSDKTNLKQKRDSLLRDGIFKLQMVGVKMAANDNELQNVRQQLRINRNKYGMKLSALSNVTGIRNMVAIDSLEKYNDSCIKLQQIIASLEEEKYLLDRRITALERDSVMIKSMVSGTNESRYSQKAYLGIKEELKRQVDTLEMKAPVATARLFWGSFNLGVSRQKYYTYFDTLAFDQQISRHFLDALDIGVSVNYYWQNFLRGQIIYMNGGISRIKDNNTADLGTIDVTDEKAVSANGTSRKSATKYSVFTDPIEEFRSWLFYGNAYYMFGKKDKSAIHFFPALEVRNVDLNMVNMGLGYVFSFRDKKDNKSIFNIEAFVKFRDIGNANGDKSAFYQRYTIGVSAGLPFNYIL